MKVLILYATRNGVTGQCAQMLKKKLDAFSEVTLCDIHKETPPSPESFDVAVLGGSVRMGHLAKALRQYLKQHKEALSGMPAAFWFCCGFPENMEDYIETQLPRGIRFSLGIHCFGGELKPEKLHGMDKFVIKAVRSSIRTRDFEASEMDQFTLPEITPENIDRLADAIRHLKGTL